MGPISEVHVAEPGIAVVEVAAADDQTAFPVGSTRCAVGDRDDGPYDTGAWRAGRTAALLPGCAPGAQLTCRGRACVVPTRWCGRGQSPQQESEAAARAAASALDRSALEPLGVPRGQLVRRAEAVGTPPRTACSWWRSGPCRGGVAWCSWRESGACPGDPGKGAHICHGGDQARVRHGERCINRLKARGAAWPRDATRSPSLTRPPSTSPASSSGPDADQGN